METQMNEQHQSQEIQNLRQRQPKHLKIGERMMKADNGNIFAMDILAVAVLNRSIRLVRGFCDQINTNFMCAAPLVRLQLDNFLRFGAARHVVNLNEFVIEIMGGTPVRKLKDRHGKPMTDAYLVELAATECPEIKDIYQRGCGFIHLCEVHIAHAVQATGHMQGCLSVSLEDDEINDELRRNAIEVMTFVTDLVLMNVDGWAQTKENPEMVRDPMKRAEMLLQIGEVETARNWLQMVVKEHPDPGVVASATARLATI
jgi:hypothetical protein